MPRPKTSNLILSSYYIYPKSIFKNIIAEEKFREQADKDLKIKNPVWVSKLRFTGSQYWKATTAEYLTFYVEDKDTFTLPRNYSLPVRSLLVDNTVAGKAITFSTSIVLRPYQESYFYDFPSIYSSNDKVLNVPCGAGKTLLGLWLSKRYSVVTLILVPTHFLAVQWANRISEFTSATYHVWKSTDKEIPEDKDFYIVSFDLFTVRVFPEFLKKNVGHVILDEAHRMGAQTYLPILSELPAKRRTALTATFRRDDGMHKILAYHFGTVYTMDYLPPKPTVHAVTMGTKKVGHCLTLSDNTKPLIEFLDFINVPYTTTKSTIQYEYNDSYIGRLVSLKLYYKIKDAKWYAQVKSQLKKSKKQSFVILDTYLSQEFYRRRKTSIIIRKCLEHGRNVLFISKRKQVLKSLYREFASYKPVLIVSGSTNKMTPEERQYMQKEAKLILGVSQLAKEGLDIDRLDTLILHLPIKDTEQAVGRINRVVKDKEHPIVLYLMDNNSMCRGMFNASKKFLAINASIGPEVSWNNISKVL